MLAIYTKFKEMIKTKSWKEKEFEEKYSSEIDNIYNSLFFIKEINRNKYSNEMTDKLFADMYLGIDTILELQNGTKLSLQEKLRHSRILNNYPPTICIELMNDEETEKVGEWFSALPQLYFVGYVNTLTDNIVEWYLIDTIKLKILLKDISLEELKAKYLKKNVPPKRANFLAIPINDIRKAVIVCSKYTSIME